MPTVDQLTLDKRFLGMFVGRSGNGKTAAAASFPKPMKVFDFDGRISGILGCDWITQAERKEIEFSTYPPFIKPGDKPSYTRLNTELEMMHMQGTKLPYKTLVFDSLTSASLALLRDSIPISGAGRKVGALELPGPGDYGFESQAISNILAYLRSLPVPNIIVSAHVVERYGKSDPDNPYSESIPIGEKLSVRDKVGENSLIYFDHVLKFERERAGGDMRYYCVFRSDLAKTTLSKAPPRIDITRKHFYNEVLQPIIKASDPSASNQTTQAPNQTS